MTDTERQTAFFAHPGEYSSKLWLLGCSFAETPLRHARTAIKRGKADGLDTARFHAGLVRSLSAAAEAAR